MICRYVKSISPPFHTNQNLSTRKYDGKLAKLLKELAVPWYSTLWEEAFTASERPIIFSELADLSAMAVAGVEAKVVREAVEDEAAEVVRKGEEEAAEVAQEEREEEAPEVVREEGEEEASEVVQEEEDRAAAERERIDAPSYAGVPLELKFRTARNGSPHIILFMIWSQGEP